MEAGAELLETWQNNWEVIHLNNERNAKKADKCDKLIVSIKDRTLKQWNDIATLQTHIPQINNGIKDIMDKLGSLESFIGDVEISLLALEDTIDAREMQEKQLDQRFQLAMYQERRKAEFNDLASKYLTKKVLMKNVINFVKSISDRLQNEYEKKKKLHSDKKSVDSAKLQKHYQSKFDEDVKSFQDGSRLQVPLRHDPDASLESVDLDDPDEAATNTLEAFLNEPDALYDVSPLPRDETPLQKTNDVDQVLEQVPINVVSTESPENNTPAGSQVVSGSASLYFTPDVTTEQLSEISLT